MNINFLGNHVCFENMQSLQSDGHLSLHANDSNQHTGEPAASQQPLFLKDFAISCLVLQDKSGLVIDSRFIWSREVHVTKRCTCAGGHLPIVSPHNLQDPLLHVFKRYGLHVGIRWTSLLRCRGSEVIHHVFQFKKEVVLKLRPLDPAGKTAVRLRPGTTDETANSSIL